MATRTAALGRRQGSYLKQPVKQLLTMARPYGM